MCRSGKSARPPVLSVECAAQVVRDCLSCYPCILLLFFYFAVRARSLHCQFVNNEFLNLIVSLGTMSLRTTRLWTSLSVRGGGPCTHSLRSRSVVALHSTHPRALTVGGSAQGPSQCPRSPSTHALDHSPLRVIHTSHSHTTHSHMTHCHVPVHSLFEIFWKRDPSAVLRVLSSPTWRAAYKFSKVPGVLT